MENSVKKGWISKNTSLFLRGIATLMVILSHFFEWSESDIGSIRVAKFVQALGDPGVGIFFFLSGYAMYKSYGQKKTDGQYIIKRLRAVYIPYIVISLIKDIYRKSIGDYDAGKLWELLKGGNLWFITVIMIIYIAYYFVGKLPEYRVAIMTVFILDLSLFYKIRGYQIFWYDAIWAFALGLIIAEFEACRGKKTETADGASGDIKKEFSIDIKDRLFCLLGRLSLYIYVLHGFLYLEFINAPVVYNNIRSYNMRLFISLVIIIVTAWVFELLFKALYKGIDKLKAGKTEVTK